MPHLLLIIRFASGPLMAGVVSRRKFFYDVSGDTANVASRVEFRGVPGRIQVSEEAFELLRLEYFLSRVKQEKQMEKA